jgi:hypothetical protein
MLCSKHNDAIHGYKKAFSYPAVQKYDVGLRVRAESTNYGVENGLHVTAA